MQRWKYIEGVKKDGWFQTEQDGEWVEYSDAEAEIEKRVQREREDIVGALMELGNDAHAPGNIEKCSISNAIRLVRARGEQKRCTCVDAPVADGCPVHDPPLPDHLRNRPEKIARLPIGEGWGPLVEVAVKKINELIDAENARRGNA